MLEFSSEKVVGTAKIEITLTENDVETIMVNGLEGGIGYWAILDNTGDDWELKPKGEPASTWATKLILDGKGVVFIDNEFEEDVWVLTLDKLIKGFELNYKERPHDADLENGDANTADCIIQYALFGELVFG